MSFCLNHSHHFEQSCWMVHLKLRNCGQLSPGRQFTSPRQKIQRQTIRQQKTRQQKTPPKNHCLWNLRPPSLNIPTALLFNQCSNLRKNFPANLMMTRRNSLGSLRSRRRPPLRRQAQSDEAAQGRRSF